jgi:hypothetical protein
VFGNISHMKDRNIFDNVKEEDIARNREKIQRNDVKKMK